MKSDLTRLRQYPQNGVILFRVPKTLIFSWVIKLSKLLKQTRGVGTLNLFDETGIIKIELHLGKFVWLSNYPGFVSRFNFYHVAVRRLSLLWKERTGTHYILKTDINTIKINRLLHFFYLSADLAKVSASQTIGIF